MSYHPLEQYLRLSLETEHGSVQNRTPGRRAAASHRVAGSAEELGYRGGQVRRRRGGEVLVTAAGELRDSLPGRPIGVGPEVDDVDRYRLGRVGALLDEFLQSLTAEALIGVRAGRDHQHRIRLSGMEIGQRVLVDQPQRGERHRPA